MGQGVPEPTQKSVTRVRSALDCFGSPFRQPTLTIGQWRPNDGIIAFMILLAPLATIVFLSWTMSHVSLDFAHSCTFGALGAFSQ
jgi:hypothetical protein